MGPSSDIATYLTNVRSTPESSHSAPLRHVCLAPKPDLARQLGLVRLSCARRANVLNDTELSEADLLCDSVREFVLFRRFPARRTSWTIFNETSANRRGCSRGRLRFHGRGDMS